MSDISIPNFRFKKYTSNLVKMRLSKIATFNPKSSLPENFKYIDLESVLGTELVSYREETRESAPSRAQRVAQKGDVFFQMVRPYQKNNYLFDLNENNYVFSTGYAQLRPKVDSAFLLARLQEEGFVNKVIERCTGTSYPAINSKDLSRISITIPEDLEEQSAIGSLFRTLDVLLASYKDNLANYQSLKTTMLSKMFPKVGQRVPEIRLDGFEGEWTIKRADEIFKSVSEKNRASLPVLSASQIVGMVLRDEIGIDIKYDEDTLNNYKVVKPGQFVIHLRSFQGGFALSKLEGVTSPAYTIIDFIDKKDNIPDFWNSILTSRDFIKRLETVTYGIRDGKSISFKDFSSLKFAYPELEEQQAIGSYFSNLDQLITSYQEKITQLETLKKKLLQDMFI
ncbi:restriction endonuclease subunit S [Streptococcus thermophilus]|uniref:restriction endonuclease subunit S n=1 Tax=Streptococcus thermophilus TaxID=1308 RepID=UPI0021AC17CE|nr:restriction endonuclease subunit S [Streptococcus thermophilus]